MNPKAQQNKRVRVLVAPHPHTVLRITSEGEVQFIEGIATNFTKKQQNHFIKNLKGYFVARIDESDLPKSDKFPKYSVKITTIKHYAHHGQDPWGEHRADVYDKNNELIGVLSWDTQYEWSPNKTNEQIYLELLKQLYGDVRVSQDVIERHGKIRQLSKNHVL